MKYESVLCISIEVNRLSDWDLTCQALIIKTYKARLLKLPLSFLQWALGTATTTSHLKCKGLMGVSEVSRQMRSDIHYDKTCAKKQILCTVFGKNTWKHGNYREPLWEKYRLSLEWDLEMKYFSFHPWSCKTPES